MMLLMLILKSKCEALMSKKEKITAIVSGLFCLCAGIALSPKITGTPLDKFTNYVSDFYSDDDDNQFIKYGYYMDGDVGQCLLLDGNNPKAKLIGVEYLISESQYRKLSKNERANWHKMDYHFDQGLIVSPSEKSDMICNKIRWKYAKTIILWDDGKDIPSNDPKVMCGFSKDYNPNEKLIEKRDLKEKISTKDTIRSREWKPFQQRKR